MLENRLIWATTGFEGGLVTSMPEWALQGDASPDAENFDPSQKFMLKMRAGIANFTGNHASPTGTMVRGLWAGEFENGTKKILAKEGTAVYDITAGNWATVVSGHPTLHDADEAHFVIFKNVVILSSEEATPIAPQKWSGTGTWGALGGSPPSAKYFVSHKGRLWGACTLADPSRVYFTVVNNHEGWSGADASNFYLNPGDGLGINGMASDGDILYVSKRSFTDPAVGALYAVFGDSAPDFQVRKIANFGAMNSRCMVPTQSFVVAACQEGIFGLQGNRLIHLSPAIAQSWKDLSGAARAEAAVGKYRDQVWVAYPAAGSTATKAYILDIPSQRWSRYNPVTARIFATGSDGVLYGAHAAVAGDAGVRVEKFNSGTADISVPDITMYWHTPELDFGRWFADKRWHQSFLFAKKQNISYTIQYFLDGTHISADTITKNPSTDGVVSRVVGRGATAEGRFFKFKITVASATTTAELYGFEVEAEARERLR